MKNSDLHANIKQALALSPVALGATGASAGKIIDRQGYGGVQFLVGYGAVTTTGSVVTALLKEGDVTGTLTSVADADIIGTETLASLAAGARTSGTSQQVVKRLGYKGTKRYVQLTLTNTGTTSAGLMWADAILFNPEVAPVSNP
jgi:hypothetical protein